MKTSDVRVAEQAASFADGLPVVQRGSRWKIAGWASLGLWLVPRSLWTCDWTTNPLIDMMESRRKRARLWTQLMMALPLVAFALFDTAIFVALGAGVIHPFLGITLWLLAIPALSTGVGAVAAAMAVRRRGHLDVDELRVTSITPAQFVQWWSLPAMASAFSVAIIASVGIALVGILPWLGHPGLATICLFSFLRFGTTLVLNYWVPLVVAHSLRASLMVASPSRAALLAARSLAWPLAVGVLLAAASVAVVWWGFPFIVALTLDPAFDFITGGTHRGHRQLAVLAGVALGAILAMAARLAVLWCLARTRATLHACELSVDEWWMVRGSDLGDRSTQQATTAR